MTRRTLRSVLPSLSFSRFACAAVTAALLSSGAFAAGDTCRRDGNMGELYACARDDLKKVDDELNALYKKQITRLTDDANKKNLRAAQKAWLTFRDASCLYEVGERTQTSGSMWPLNYLGCQTTFTQKRVVELKEYVACTRADDFCPE